MGLPLGTGSPGRRVSMPVSFSHRRVGSSILDAQLEESTTYGNCSAQTRTATSCYAYSCLRCWRRNSPQFVRFAGRHNSGHSRRSIYECAPATCLRRLGLIWDYEAAAASVALESIFETAPLRAENTLLIRFSWTHSGLTNPRHYACISRIPTPGLHSSLVPSLIILSHVEPALVADRDALVGPAFRPNRAAHWAAIALCVHRVAAW